MTIASPDLLTDGIVTLRPPEPYDIDTILRWENDTVAWTSATTAAPFSRRNIEDYIVTYDPDIFATRQLRLIIEHEGKAVGAVDLFDFDPVNRRAGMGIVIDPSQRRKGLARRALTLLSSYGASRIGLHQIWAMAAADNLASRAMLLSSGYAVAGRFRSWLRRGESYEDAYLYQQLLTRRS